MIILTGTAALVVILLCAVIVSADFVQKLRETVRKGRTAAIRQSNARKGVKP